jgi:cytochrome d ubiquinol oxidase subunit II
VTAANIVLVFLWSGVTAYAVLAGADFGAGVWDLFAGTSALGSRQRRRIADSIGPVWEANHVWLIFALVVLWTGFPAVFAAMASTLYLPLTVAAFGIIIRGSSFALRQGAPQLRLKRVFGPGFAIASLVTPYFLGTVAGAIASGRVPLGNARGDVLRSWTSPTSQLAGLLAAAACAYLGAAYLVVDARRHAEHELVEMFRKRALVAGAVSALGALAGIPVLHADAPRLFSGLGGRGLPLLLVSVAMAATSMVRLWLRRYTLTRVIAALAVVTVLWAWAAAQYPDLLVGSATVSQTAAPVSTLVALIVVLAIGSVLLLPSLALLFWLVRLPNAVDSGGEAVARSVPVRPPSS